MEKVFIDNLPKRGKTINWKKSIGYKVKGVYRDIEFEVEIIDYKNDYLYIKYLNNPIFKIHSTHFKNCRLGRLLGVVTDKFKVEIGQILKDDKRDIEIIDRKYEDKIDKNGYMYKAKWYRYKCNKCGNSDWKLENHLLKGTGCFVCSKYRKIVVEHINSIVAKEETHWMIPYFQGGYNEAKLYTRSSNHKIYPICPDCGRVKNKEVSICSIYKTHSIGCSCGDGIKYPEKFVFNLLEQLGINFTTQLTKTTFKWCEEYRYDFYIPIFNIIIETHGRQHYKDTSGLFLKTLEEEQENDRIKKQLALKNGIKEESYIVIDCRESNLEFIKQNILISSLSEIFDLSKINWNKVQEFALNNNIKKEVSNYYNSNNNVSIQEIADEFKMNKTTIRKYLKDGNILNWCTYNSDSEKLRQKGKRIGGKPVEIFKNLVSLGVFANCVELEEKSYDLYNTTLEGANISSVCLGKRPHHKGFTFKYVSKKDYILFIEQNKEYERYDFKNDALRTKAVKIFKDKELLGVFESARELERKSEELFGVKLNYKSISAVCLRKAKTHKGYTFCYCDNYEIVKL